MSLLSSGRNHTCGCLPRLRAPDEVAFKVQDWLRLKAKEGKHGSVVVSVDCPFHGCPRDPLPRGLQQTSLSWVAPPKTHDPNELDPRRKHLRQRFRVLGSSRDGRVKRAPFQLPADMPASAATWRQTADVCWRNAQVIWHQAPQRVRG